MVFGEVVEEKKQHKLLTHLSESTTTMTWKLVFKLILVFGFMGSKILMEHLNIYKTCSSVDQSGDIMEI